MPHPSRYVVLSAFIWQQALASKTCEYQEEEETIYVVNLDLRPRMKPPLPAASIGNLITQTVASAKARATLPEFAASIDAAIRARVEEIKEYEGEKGVNAIRENSDEFRKLALKHQDMAYGSTSWCNLGFSDLDFGFGKPKWTIPTDGRIPPYARNLTILNDYSDLEGVGIEVWLFLEEKDMESLESNPEFLAFASPTSPIHKC